MMLLNGKIFFTKHAIERYRLRVINNKYNLMTQEFDDDDIKVMIKKDLRGKNIKKVIYIDNMCYVYTKSHIEYRLEKCKRGWLVITLIKYKRMLPNQEPRFEDYLKDTTLQSGIRTAIKLREKQIEDYNIE